MTLAQKLIVVIGMIAAFVLDIGAGYGSEKERADRWYAEHPAVKFRPVAIVITDESRQMLACWIGPAVQRPPLKAPPPVLACQP